MANRFFNQFKMSLEKKVCCIFGHVTIGASGAPTLDTVNSKGIISVVHDGTGLYTFKFGSNSLLLDVYVKLLMVNIRYDESGNSGTAPLAPLSYVNANNVSVVGTSSIQLKFTNSSGTATDPASGEALYIEFVLGDSTAP